MTEAAAGASASPARPNPWGFGEAAVGYAVGLVVSLVTTSAAENLTGYAAGSKANIPVAVSVASVLGLWVGLVGAAVRASRAKGTGSLARDFGFRIAVWWEVVAGALIGLVCQYGLIPLLYLPFEQFDPTLSQRLSAPAQQDTAAAHGDLQIGVLLLFLAVGAPIVEELFFRGLLLRALLARLPTAVAIVASALLFALAHFEPLQFGGLAAFGVVLGLLAWRLGRLGPGMAAHAAFNAAAVISLAHGH